VRGGNKYSFLFYIYVIMMERTPYTKAQQKTADAAEKLRKNEITKDFKKCLGYDSKLYFFDGTVLYGKVYKEGKNYFIKLSLEGALGSSMEELPPVKLPPLQEFLSCLRKIYVPVLL